MTITDLSNSFSFLWVFGFSPKGIIFVFHIEIEREREKEPQTIEEFHVYNQFICCKNTQHTTMTNYANFFFFYNHCIIVISITIKQFTILLIYMVPIIFFFVQFECIESYFFMILYRSFSIPC